MVRDRRVGGVGRAGREATDAERLGGVDREKVLVVARDVAQQTNRAVRLVIRLRARRGGRDSQKPTPRGFAWMISLGRATGSAPRSR